MQFNRFAPNLLIANDSRFGNFNINIVTGILRAIDINFSQCLGKESFSSKVCFIQYHPDYPMCSDFRGTHIVFLTSHEDYWCQWAYQFAHEYCHHLIDGKLTGEVSGLMWFEEAICELASMYHLHLLHLQWTDAGNPWAPKVRDYLDGLLSKNPQLLLLTARPRWLQSWAEILSEPKHHREYSNAIAAKILPLFLENPSLWKILLHFGDMRVWLSLEDLFVHLRLTADDSYSDSLQSLRDLLHS